MCGCFESLGVHLSSVTERLVLRACDTVTDGQPHSNININHSEPSWGVRVRGAEAE